MGDAGNDETTTATPTKTVFLDDLPTDDDAIGPHIGIARAISEVIHDENIQGGKTIGLTGTWGSGKSTVMELIRRDFESQQEGEGPQAKIFIFDSWAHQGDPLRRSFLEELGLFLNDKKVKWGSEAHTNQSLKQLTTVQQTTETINTSRLSCAGVAFGFSLFVALAANSLLNHYAWDQVFPSKYDLPVPHALLDQPTIGCLLLVLALAPLWVVLAAYLLRVLCRIKRVGKLVSWIKRVLRRIWSFVKEEGSNDEESFFSLLLQKTPEKETTSYDRVANPTSLEFRRCFIDMLEVTLGSEPKRRLVIALDNLDRVDAEDALTIISTMRLFIDPLEVRKFPFLKQLWIIFPVDVGALQQLWSSTNGNRTLPDGPPDREGSTEADKEAPNSAPRQKAAAFVDKIFQIRFHVPEPVLPSWQDYLAKLLEKAFPDLSRTDSDSFSVVLRLFHIKGIPEHRPLSPRDCKSFVNRLVAIYRVRPEIRIPILALWVLYSKEIEKLRNNFSEMGFIPEHVRAVVENYVPYYSLEVYLAAIHFNVSLEAAFHTTVEPHIKKAIDAGNPSSLAGWADVPGFFQLCEDVVEDYCDVRYKRAPLILLQAAAVFGEMDLNQDVFVRRTLRLLNGYLSKISGLQGITLNHMNGILTLLQFSTGQGEETRLEFEKLLLTILSNSLQEKPSEADDSNWIKTVLQILHRICPQKPDLVDEFFKVQGDSNVYARVVLHLCRHNVSDTMIRLFRPSDSGSTFCKGVLNSVLSGYTEANEVEIFTHPLYIMRQIPREWPWSQATVWIRKNLEGQKRDQAVKVGLQALEVLHSLVLSGVDNEATDYFTEMVQKRSLGFLWRWYEYAPEETIACYVVSRLLCLPEIKKGLAADPFNAPALKTEYEKSAAEPEQYRKVISAVARMLHRHRLEERFKTVTSEKPRLKAFVSAVQSKIEDFVSEEKRRSEQEYETALGKKG